MYVGVVSSFYFYLFILTEVGYIFLVFKKSYIVHKGPPLGDKKLKTKEKKKTEIKREKRLVQVLQI